MDFLSGYGRPTKRTKAQVGQYYKDLDTGDVYRCISANENSRVNLSLIGGYIWERAADSEHLEVCETFCGGGSEDIRNELDKLSEEMVKVTPQELTEEQKSQVRANIGAIGGESETVSGEVVQIGGGDILSYRIDIDATTKGVGLVYLHERGKNMLNFFADAADTYDSLYEGFTKTVDGVTVTIQGGRIIATGTNTKAGWNSFLKYKPLNASVGYFPAGTYTLPTGMTAQFVGASGNKQGTFTLDRGYVLNYVYLTVASGTVVNINIPLTILAGSESPTEYIPFEGVLYNISLPVGTVSYGGYIDSEAGMLVNTHDSNGSELAEPVEIGIANLPKLMKLAGITNVFANTDAGLSADVRVSTGYNVEQTIRDLEEAIAKVAKFDYKAYGLPMLYLTGDTSAMTKDNAVDLQYVYGDKSGTASVKWQGSSSLNYAKKNYTVKFDQAFEAVDGWGAQKKYCFKANYIDHSHARNICSCKLWGEIVKSRTNVPSELVSLVNGGAIDGFPCIIMLNGEFHGLYTWNIPKDGWMFGSPKAILCADAHSDATKFKALATLNGDFELEYVEDEDNADWVLPSINTAIQAVMNSSGNDIDTVVGQYIDIPSAIDYYIHTVDEKAEDGTDKNYILVTFDGVKWYFSAYDRDTVYGLYWNGKSITAPTSQYLSFAGYAAGHQLMNLIYNYKKPELKARAIELRGGIKSEVNVATVFSNFIGSIPSQIYDEDVRKWPTIPSTSVSNLAQILNWYRLRRQVIDKEIDGWTV